MHHWNNKQLIFDSHGNKLSDKLTDRLSTTLWDIIEEAFQFSEAAHAKNGGRDIAITDSLQDFIRRRAAELALDKEDCETLLKMSEMFGAYVGEPVWKQSLRFAWLEECCGGGASPFRLLAARRPSHIIKSVYSPNTEEMFVATNYSAILELAARPALRGATIHLNTRVVAVTSIGSPSPSERQRVTVTTDLGKVLSFDEVVLTTPLGWLKQHHQSVFSPALPARLTSAIVNISLSQLEKVFITFPSAFWRTQPGETFPSYTNWLTPRYAESTNPHHWPQEIWDLSSFDAPNNHPTILFYLYGDCSRHVVDAIHGKTPEVKHRFLENFFRPYYSLLPEYDSSDARCTPSAILATEWAKDELNGFGSYCNFQVGVEAADQDVLAFREGCAERRLWFCGEHAAPFEECGTVAGAYLSGEAVAKKVTALYKEDDWQGKKAD